MTVLVNHMKSFAHQVKIHNPLANVEGAMKVNPVRKAAMALPFIGPFVALQFRLSHEFSHTQADVRADRRVTHCELTGAVLQAALIVGLLAVSIIFGAPIIGAAVGLGLTIAGIAFGAYRSYKLTQELSRLQAPEKQYSDSL